MPEFSFNLNVTIRPIWDVAVTLEPGIEASLAEALTITEITPTADQITVAFTLGLTGGIPVLDIEYQLDGSGPWVSSGVDESPVLIDGEDGVAAYVKLRAITAVGAGEASEAAIVPPTAPEYEVESVTDTTVTF